MRRKLSKTSIALIFFILLLVLSLAGMFLMASIYGPEYYLTANKLNYRPEKYSVLENPDKYTLEAINNGHSSRFHSLEDTNYDEKMDEYIKTLGWDFNFGYNNSYYSIWLVCVENILPLGFPFILLAGIVISAIGVVILSVKTRRNRRLAKKT